MKPLPEKEEQKEEINLDDIYTVIKYRKIMDDPARRKKVIADMDALSRKLKRITLQIKGE